MYMGKKVKFRRTTLNRELIFVIVAALITAIFSYVLISRISSRFLDSRFATDEYYLSEDLKMISSLEKYVEEYSVESSDVSKLSRWADANPVSYITIYKDGKLAYLSEHISRKDRFKLENESAYERNVAYQVNFRDGPCDVILFGNYAASYYGAANVIKVAIPFVLFIMILLLVIGRKIRYIVQLEYDVNLIKSGNYDHSVHKEGRDELLALADSIEKMRDAYNQKIDEINHLLEDNREFITEMSHDLRTPMTPLLVYLGMLREKRYENEEERDKYVLKANEKAVQLKHMSDHMFASMLVNQREALELSGMSVNSAFYDQMSALADYLGTEEFRIDAGSVNPSDEVVLVNMESVARIFDNIMSNILKYADKTEPLVIYMNVEPARGEEEKENLPESFREPGECEEKEAVIRFSNKINELADYSSSTGFGVKNIRKMMAQMNGECLIEQKEQTYAIELRFPIEENFRPEADSEQED